MIWKAVFPFSLFQLTHVFQHPLFSLHPALFLLAFSQLAQGELYVSSLRIQPWPGGLGHTTCTLHASKGKSTIWSQGLWTGFIDALVKFISCLFTQESFDLGRLPSPSFVSAGLLSDVSWSSGQGGAVKKMRMVNEKHREAAPACTWIMAATPIPWCLIYKLHLVHLHTPRFSAWLYSVWKDQMHAL